MLKFIKKRSSKKLRKKQQQSPGNVRKHISLPLVEAGTQADFSPKTLKPKDSLLNYSVASAPATPLDDDIEPGYSTVRETTAPVVHHHSKQDGHAKNRAQPDEGDQESVRLRPLPPVPVDDDDDNEYDDESHSPVSLTVNQQHRLGTEHGNESTGGNNRSPRSESNESEAVLKSMYARVNKRKGLNKQQSTKGQRSPPQSHRSPPHSQRSNKSVEKPKVFDDEEKESSCSSDVFELSDSLDDDDDGGLFDAINGSSLANNQLQTSPVLPRHRPPPSPNSRRSGTPPHKVKLKLTPSAVNEYPTYLQQQKKNGDTKSSKKKAMTPQQQASSNMDNIPPLMPDDLNGLPVYNLNQSQSVTEGTTAGYILTRTDPEGRVECFRATPVFSPAPNVSPLPSHTGYGVPMDSSTPVKPMEGSNHFQIQTISPPLQPAHTPVPIPAHPRFSIPLSQQSVPQHSIPVLPQPTLNISPSLQQQYTTVSGSLLPQPTGPSPPYIAGLSEISQLLSEHQNKTTTTTTSDRVTSVKKSTTEKKQAKEVSTNTASNYVDTPLTITTTVTTDPPSYSISTASSCGSVSGVNDDTVSSLKKKDDQIHSLSNENTSLRETIHHLSQQLSTFIPSQQKQETMDLSPQKLVTETPVKLKRVLDKLLNESVDKDRQIDLLKANLSSLKTELADVSLKRAQLDESYKEEIHSTNIERQSLRDSLTQVTRDNEELKVKLLSISGKLNSAQNEHEQKVYRLKEEMKGLKKELSRFQSSIHSVGHHCIDLQGMVAACDSHTHSSLEDHKQTLAGLERLLHQVMHKSNSLSHQQTIEMSRIKQLNDVLSNELAEIKGSLSIVSEECQVLRRQKSEYEGTISSLTQELKFSQAREKQAVQCLSDSLRGASTCLPSQQKPVRSKMTLKREQELDEMIKKLDEYKLSSRPERHKKLEKFRLRDNSHRYQHGQKKKSMDKISNLRSELARKEVLLQEVNQDKRIAEKQRDILWDQTISSKN